MNAAMFREAAAVRAMATGCPSLRTVWVAIRYRPARMAIQLDDRTSEPAR